ncbi:MAG: sterol desaturase family protein [Pseudomonadota bacterium]
MQTLITLTANNNPIPLVLCAMAFFLVIYSTFSGLVFLLARQANRPIEKRVVTGKQLATELINSMRSIALFGLGMIVPWWLMRNGYASIATTASAMQIAVECVILILWNDLHFYIVHRLLHTNFKWLSLKPAHITHHKSIAATPFAAYSMSVTEALMLGSVMPIAMLIWDFSAFSLLFLPVWSIAINALAHSNCDLFPNAPQRSYLNLVKHHQSHHSHYHGNYSFFFWPLDAYLGTLRK